MKYDFSGWATRNDLMCADGRTIRKDAFKDCDGKTVPLVWNHRHNEPSNILGHARLENREDGVYAYCTLNETTNGKAAREFVQHGDVEALSIYANCLRQTPNKDVLHGDIREVSLVIAGANPGAFIDFVDMAHSVEGYETELVMSPNQPISLFHSTEKAELSHSNDNKEEKKEEPKEESKEEKTDENETIQDVFDTLTEKQKTVVYAIIGAALSDEEGDDDDEDENSKGGKNSMKQNAFENTTSKDDVLIHAEDRAEILRLAKSNSVGSFQTALKIYAEQNSLAHGIDNIESLFPDFKDLRPGAPEKITRDQGWVTVVMQKVTKTPFARIRTRQMDTRNDSLRAHGYKKGQRKQPSGNMNMISRTTDPQTVYYTDSLNRDDIVDITDFDVVEYQYQTMREYLNEEVATAIMVGDGRDASDQMKISEDHIRSIWNDNDTYTIHYDVDIDAARSAIQGTSTEASFGENYIYAEAIVAASLYSREKYRGTGRPDFFCTPHLVNVMLLARDMNGRRIYDSVNELAAVLNVGNIYTAEQFDGLVRTDNEGKEHKLLGIFVNLSDYTVGSAKGGEITRFDQFDIDFNQNKYLIETRISGALSKAYSAIALEELSE